MKVPWPPLLLVGAVTAAKVLGGLSTSVSVGVPVAVAVPHVAPVVVPKMMAASFVPLPYAKSMAAALVAAISAVAPLSTVTVLESVGGSAISVPAPPLMLVKVQTVPV